MFRFAPIYRLPKAQSRQAGFTLLELLVVLAILALLAGLVGPRVLEQLSGARADTAKIQIKNIEAALDLYRLDVGRYPTTSDGLQALLDKPANATRWRGPYLKSSDGIIDPWGETYRYRRDGGKNTYEVFSFGADKSEGGEGDDADIRNR
jgi:general secretion pathway protein G